MLFRITGLDPAPFTSLYGLSDRALATRGVIRMVADADPGFPDRIELRDVAVGESVLLLNHTHQAAETPYRASHAVFVREGATEVRAISDHVPAMLRRRLLSVRGFDKAGMMVDADVVDGPQLEKVIARFWGDARVAYLHVHFAKPGCYAARVDRPSRRRVTLRNGGGVIGRRGCQTEASANACSSL